MLATLKLMLGIDAADLTKDSLLNCLLELAESDFRNMTGWSADSIPSALIVQMAIVKYNLLGEEGLTSQTISGISENYEGYDALLPQIKKYRKAKFI